MGVDNDGVNYSVMFSQSTDNWTCKPQLLSRFGLPPCHEVEGAASLCLRSTE